MLKMREGEGQFRFERCNKLSTRGGKSFGAVLAANEDDTGGQDIRTTLQALVTLRPNWPRTRNSKSGLDHCFEESLPASATDPSVVFRFRLLEGVVDGYWKSRV